MHVTKKFNIILMAFLLYGSLLNAMNMDTKILYGLEVRVGAGLVGLLGAGATLMSLNYTNDGRVPIASAAITAGATFTTFQYLDRFSVQNQFAYLKNQTEQLEKSGIIKTWKNIAIANSRYMEHLRKNELGLEFIENEYSSSLLTILSPHISIQQNTIHSIETYCGQLASLITNEQKRLEYIEQKNHTTTFGDKVDTSGVKKSLLDIKFKVASLMQYIQSLDLYKKATQLKIGMDKNNIALEKQKSYRWGIILPIFLPLLSLLLPYIFQHMQQAQ